MTEFMEHGMTKKINWAEKNNNTTINHIKNKSIIYNKKNIAITGNKKQFGFDRLKEKVRNIKARQWICIILILLVLVLAIAGICYFIVHGEEHQNYVYGDVEDDIANLEKREVVIVPGATVSDEAIGSIGKDRLNMAIKLYEQGSVKKIVVSGESTQEAYLMADYLEVRDIPNNDIYVDILGTNTYATISRVKEKYGKKSSYFCTQEMYSDRAAYLIKRLGLKSQIICVDTMYYKVSKKAVAREILAATKAVFEPTIRRNNPNVSIKDEDYRQPEALEHKENKNVVFEEDLEIPMDCVVEDINSDDGYDVKKAVEYARKYAFVANEKYPLFEMNCTNFVSQCLLEGGILSEGEGDISNENQYEVSKTDSGWYSVSGRSNKTSRMHYSTNYNFINTERFIEYFTKTRGYELSVYKNDYDGKFECYNEIASGDVLIFYGKKDKIEHLGIVTGKGDMNAYYCSNNNARRDCGVFTVNDDIYPKMGILHMSGKK